MARLTEKITRILKGQYMGLMFLAFGSGIIFFLIFFVPVLWVLDKLFGSNPSRSQSAIRKLFGAWLFWMRVGGLLRSRPIKGRLPPGPFVVVANHPGLFDVVVLIRDIPKLCVLVKSKLVRQLPLWRIFRSAGYIVAPERDSFGAVEVLEQAMDVLRKGYSFMIFPEGTRSPRSRMRHFGAGAFKLAQRANVPVLPVLIKNTPPFLPKEDRWYFPPLRSCPVELEFWDLVPPPAEGEERNEALKLERRYRQALGLESSSPIVEAGEADRGGMDPAFC